MAGPRIRTGILTNRRASRQDAAAQARVHTWFHVVLHHGIAEVTFGGPAFFPSSRVVVIAAPEPFRPITRARPRGIDEELLAIGQRGLEPHVLAAIVVLAGVRGAARQP